MKWSRLWLVFDAFIVFMFLLSLCHAQEEPDPDMWTHENTMMQLGTATLAVANATNLRYCLDAGKCSNPDFILGGRRPSQLRIYSGLILSVAAQSYLAYILPADWRRVYQLCSVFIIGGDTVKRAYRVGWQFEW